MKIRLLVSAVAVALATQAIGTAQEQAPAPPRLQLAFEGDGTVTLVSNGATLREILAEWTRKGGTPFPGAERLAGGALSLEFDKEPEAKVLSSLLRSAAGYILGPRREGSVGASQFEVVYVVATSNATASAYSPPVYTPPQPQVSTAGNPDTEIPPAAAPGAQPGAPAGQPNPTAPPATNPATRPSGVAVPVVPVVPVTIPPPTTTGRGGGGGGGGGR